MNTPSAAGGSRRSDIELAASSAGGDAEAWDELVRRHAPRLAAYLGARLRRWDIIDRLVADSLCQAWELRHELAASSDVAGRLRRIAAGLATAWAREHPAEPIDEPVPEARLAGVPAGVRDELRQLDAAIARLSEIQRMAVELRYRGGCDEDELAGALRLPVEDARRILAAAEAALAAGLPQPPGAALDL